VKMLYDVRDGSNDPSQLRTRIHYCA